MYKSLFNNMNSSNGFLIVGTSPLLKFKWAVSTVIDNLSWLNNDDELLRTPINFFDMKSDVILKESSDFTAFHKLILFKPPNQRTQFELESIEWMFAVGFSFFDSCPIETKMALIGHASYKCYGPGRWILKEGRLTENMYLIVEGHVRVTENKYNCAFNTMEIVEHCKLYAKYSFGESAVMFDTHRTTSVQSLSTVELISISKNDFTNTIKDSLKIQWDTNAIAIRNSPYFKHLSDMELHKCSTVSFIKTFAENDRVLGGGGGPGVRDHGHFVIEGKVSMMYELMKTTVTTAKRGDGVLSYRSTKTPPPKQAKNDEQNVNKYADRRIFLSDSCFNIGENTDRKQFIASDIKGTKCLCVPHWFMKKTEKLNNWTFVRLDLEQSILRTNAAECSEKSPTTRKKKDQHEYVKTKQYIRK